MKITTNKGKDWLCRDNQSTERDICVNDEGDLMTSVGASPNRSLLYHAGDPTSIPTGSNGIIRTASNGSHDNCNHDIRKAVKIVTGGNELHILGSERGVPQAFLRTQLIHQLPSNKALVK